MLFHAFRSLGGVVGSTGDGTPVLLIADLNSHSAV